MGGYRGANQQPGGGLFNIQNDGRLLSNISLAGATTISTTRGRCAKWPAAAPPFSTRFTNSGTVEAQTGTINFAGAYSNDPSANLSISLGELPSAMATATLTSTTPSP